MELNDTLITYGSEVKALQDGRVGGYLVRFSTALDPDLTGDFFTKSTNFGPHTSTPVIYHHGMDSMIGRRPIGQGQLTIDDTGVWIEAQLSLRDEYEKAIWEMAKSGKLSWSSGTAPHLVGRKSRGVAREITDWPLGVDASLTPTPAEWRNVVVPLKSLMTGAIAMDEEMNQGTLASADDAVVAEHPPAENESGGAEDTGAVPPDALTQLQEDLAVIREEVKSLKAGAPAQRTGGVITPVHRDAPGREEAEIKAFARFLRNPGDQEYATKFIKNTLQVSDAAGGGYLIAPQQVSTDILKDMDRRNVIRGLATVMQTDTAEGLGVLTLDNDIGDPGWGVELDAGTETTDMKLGKRSLRPHELMRWIALSNTLIRQSRVDIVSYVRERLSYKFSYATEGAYMTGDGNQKPLGIFVASDSGIPTSRDVTTEKAAMTGDDFISVKHKLRHMYWSQAAWIIHPDVHEAVEKLKDGSGNYIWREALTEDAPPRLLGRPVYLSEYAPSTISAGEYVAILGVFQYYYILDGLNLQIMVNQYEKMSTNQTVYYGRYEGDGAPMLAEAFARLKMKA